MRCLNGEDDNEQLFDDRKVHTSRNRNVSGCQNHWDTMMILMPNDFYCAMTGDFVIRIAQG